MAWIESHQALARHPKTLELKNYMNWSLDETIGKLHRFWWWCYDYAIDGDLSKYHAAVIANGIDVPSDQAEHFLKSMISARWIDESPYIRVHAWWDYAGKFLQLKYRKKPEFWSKIKAMYEDMTSTVSSTPPPNQTIPNQTKPLTATLPSQDALTRFEQEFWKPFPVRDGKKLYKLKAKERFLALTEEDQRLCCAAVKSYARHCQQSTRLPKDPHRFIKGQDGELWREFVPAEPKHAPVAVPVARPADKPLVGEPCPPEAAEILKRLGVSVPNL